MESPIVFLDTNVFMYAAGAPHPCKEPCVRVLADVENGDLHAAINTEVLQELLYRYSHLRIPGKGVELCRMVLEYPVVILSVTERDLRVAIDLYGSSEAHGVQPRDAVHAATMLNHGITRVISADRAFDLFEQLVRIDPTAYMTLQ